MTINSKVNNPIPKTCAIFCGGESSRMGKPKAGIVLPNGKTMAGHVYTILNQLFEKIIFVGHGEGVPSELLRKSIHIKDEIPHCGPLGAMDALLSSNIDEEYVISPVDLPEAVSQLYLLLTDDKVKSPAVLACNGNIEPLIGRYHQDLLPLVRYQMKRHEFSMKAFLSKCSPQQIEVPAYLQFALKNANTPTDILFKK